MECHGTTSVNPHRAYTKKEKTKLKTQLLKFADSTNMLEPISIVLCSTTRLMYV